MISKACNQFFIGNYSATPCGTDVTVQIARDLFEFKENTRSAPSFSLAHMSPFDAEIGQITG